MLTTANSREVEQNVISDVNANLPAPESSRKKVLSPEAAILFDKSIVARPLMVPEVCSIRVKNLEYRYRWVNFSGRNGAIYMQRKAQGFTNATTDDVEVLGGDTTADNAKITAGDVILMKIRADLYDAAMKYNMQKAQVLQRSRGMYLKGGSGDVNSDAVAEKVSIGNDAHLSGGAFIPTGKESPDNLLARAAGDAELARKQTSEIREKIAADKKAAKEA